MGEKKKVSGILPSEGLTPGTLREASPVVNTGDFCVRGDDTKYTYSAVTHTLTIHDGAELTITGATSEDKIVVETGAAAAITLQGVSIDLSGKCNAPALDITNAAVVLTLAEGAANVLRNAADPATLQAPDGACLTIRGAGKLEVTNGGYGAAIGGRGTAGDADGQKSGRIVIEDSAIVTATGSDGAGIGGGFSMRQKGGDGGTTMIRGAVNVTAESTFGAGIGGGCGDESGGSGGTVTIKESAKVTATSAYGAGIGGGYGDGAGGSGGHITIESTAAVFAKTVGGSGNPMPIGGGGSGNSDGIPGDAGIIARPGAIEK